VPAHSLVQGTFSQLIWALKSVIQILIDATLAQCRQNMTQCKPSIGAQQTGTEIE